MDIESLENKARRILGPDWADVEMRDDYSGRYMFGKKSAFAFSTDHPPTTPIGKKLRALGLFSDALGTGYIYYLPDAPLNTANEEQEIENMDEFFDIDDVIEELHETLLENVDVEAHLEAVQDFDALVAEGLYEAAVELAFQILEAEGLDEGTIRKMRSGTRSKMMRSRKTKTGAERMRNKAARMQYKRSSALRRKKALYGKRYRRLRR